MRASLIDQISRKSLRLSGKARLEMTNGRLTTSVSGDCSFLDFAAPMAVECFTQPITIAIGMALLLYNLGYSALVVSISVPTLNPCKGGNADYFLCRALPFSLVQPLSWPSFSLK